MTLSEYFALAHGNQAAFVKATGLAQAFASSIALGGRPVPAEHGAAIERATGGQVTRQELFPDTWERIWPELAPAGGAGKFSDTPPIDHAAELRGAIAQTRLVFEGRTHADQALDYLELVLTSNIAKSIAATLTEMKDAMPTAALAPPRDNSAVAQIKREVFTTADQLQQPADLVVQMLVLAELRGMRAEQHHESAAGRANTDFVLGHKAIDAAKEWVAGAEYCSKLGMPPPDPSKLLEYLTNPVAG